MDKITKLIMDNPEMFVMVWILCNIAAFAIFDGYGLAISNGLFLLFIGIVTIFQTFKNFKNNRRD